MLAGPPSLHWVLGNFHGSKDNLCDIDLIRLLVLVDLKLWTSVMAWAWVLDFVVFYCRDHCRQMFQIFNSWEMFNVFIRSISPLFTWYTTQRCWVDNGSNMDQKRWLVWILWDGETQKRWVVQTLWHGETQNKLLVQTIWHGETQKRILEYTVLRIKGRSRHNASCMKHAWIYQYWFTWNWRQCNKTGNWNDEADVEGT